MTTVLCLSVFIVYTLYYWLTVSLYAASLLIVISIGWLGFTFGLTPYKYVVDKESVGAFAGKVLVREGAEKTESQETNANLCVSPNARMYSQPMLEIYADDVKCSHGATIGRLNEEEQFYMRSRGITLEDARVLQMISFLAPVLESISDEAKREEIALQLESAIRSL